MAVRNSSSFDFAEVVKKYLAEYNTDVYEAMFHAIDKVSAETVRKLKAESAAQFQPSGKHDKQYSKGWARKFENGRLKVGAIVYGKSGTYQLSHLLEFGHATRNGTGRKFAKTPAHVHIEPINQWAQDRAVDLIIEDITRASR